MHLYVIDDNMDNHRDRDSVCYAILYISTHAVHSSIITYLCHCHCHPRRPVLDVYKYSLAHNGKDINSFRTSSSQPLDSDPRADPKTPENPVSLSTMTSIYSKSNELFCQLTDQLSNSFSKIYLKPHKFETTIAKFTIDGRNSGTSSAEVTPATTPQTSPYTLRKDDGR